MKFEPIILDAQDRQETLYMAKLAEQAERYEEMVLMMKKIVEEGKVMSVEERNLLSVAYKNVVGTRRSAWRMVSSTEGTPAGGAEQIRLDMAAELKENIEGEISTFCYQVLVLLDNYLIPTCSKDDEENLVFYFKMRGDYYRYLAEVESGEQRTKVAMESKAAYEEAYNAAQSLPMSNYVRLGLALNFSTYWYDIAGDRQTACKIARKAFDDAIPELHSLELVTSYRETTLILQLLRDNLTLWMTEEEEEWLESQKKGQGQGQGQIEAQGQTEDIEGVNQSQRGYYR